MSERQEAASPDLAPFVSEYFWRYDLDHKLAQHVRRSDGLVVTARRMTEAEIEREMRKSGQAAQGGDEMQADPLVTKKFPGSSLTITAIGGIGAGGDKLCSTKCDCGVEQGNVILSQITRGVKKYCNGLKCPIARRVKEQNRTNRPVAAAKGNGTGKVSRKVSRVSRKPARTSARRDPDEVHGIKGAGPAAPPAVDPGELFPPRKIDLGPSWFGWRGALAEEATLLRKTAVAILTGTVKDPMELVRAMRDQADKLDELVYSEN